MYYWAIAISVWLWSEIIACFNSISHDSNVDPSITTTDPLYFEVKQLELEIALKMCACVLSKNSQQLNSQTVRFFYIILWCTSSLFTHSAINYAQVNKYASVSSFLWLLLTLSLYAFNRRKIMPFWYYK